MYYLWRYDDSPIPYKPLETINFTYGDSNRKDLLTAVNGTELTYDEVGNVLTYGDRSFVWNSGRYLESITDGENTYSYTYDENGIRTSKTINGKTTYINTRDGVVISQTDGTDTMYFQYDESGAPLGFIYNGEQYFYMTNQNGDVIAITLSNGDAIGSYGYDAWGKMICTDVIDENNAEYVKIVNENPLRYRGYYYDTETEYYYLESRYYDPNICRFINTDDHNYLDLDTVNGLNLFAYCGNDPVNNIDPTGFAAPKTDGDVEISNIIKYYHLNQSKFNCFSHAIGVYDKHTIIPNFNNLKTLDQCKKNTISYLEKNGYKVKDVTNSGGCNYKTKGYTWLIALRIGSFIDPETKQRFRDFHFMKRSNLDNVWSFKAGKGGAVYNLKSGKKPSNVNWNIYYINSKKIRVNKAYTGKIVYLAISN